MENLSKKVKNVLKQNIINFFLDDNNDKLKNNNICITGKWGSGKSTFITDFLEELKDQNINIIFISIWIYEIAPDKFSYLFFDMIEKIFADDNLEASITLKDSLKTWLNFFLFGKIEKIEKKIQKMRSNNVQKNIEFKDNFDYLAKIDWFIEEVNSYTKGKKIIVVFDEMDRCTDQEQLIFLNVLKNIFFRLKNIFFIVCCNTEVIDKHMILTNNESYCNKIFANTIKISNLVEFEAKKANNEFYSDFINIYYGELIHLYGFRYLENLINKTKKNLFFDPDDDYTLVNDYIFYLNFLKFYNIEKFDWLHKNSSKENYNLIQFFPKLFSENDIKTVKNLYSLNLSNTWKVIKKNAWFPLDLSIALASYKYKRIDVGFDNLSEVVKDENNLIFKNENMSNYFDLDVYEFLERICRWRGRDITPEFNWFAKYYDILQKKHSMNVTAFDLIDYISKE